MNEEKVKRLFFIKDFVYGSIDGVITTFAIVSGVKGAALTPSIILILGFANLIADGLSMSISNYLSVKSEQELYEKERKREEKEVENIPEEERKEIEEIYKKKGFTGKLLNKVVSVITRNKRVWVETMMKEELGLIVDKINPVISALITFASFVIMGLIPLSTFIIGIYSPFFANNAFSVSLLLTSASLFTIGVVKARLLKKEWYWVGLQTLLIGGIAAIAAYSVGSLLKTVRI